MVNYINQGFRKDITSLPQDFQALVPLVMDDLSYSNDEWPCFAVTTVGEELFILWVTGSYHGDDDDIQGATLFYLKSYPVNREDPSYFEAGDPGRLMMSEDTHSMEQLIDFLRGVLS